MDRPLPPGYTPPTPHHRSALHLQRSLPLACPTLTDSPPRGSRRTYTSTCCSPGIVTACPRRPSVYLTRYRQTRALTADGRLVQTPSRRTSNFRCTPYCAAHHLCESLSLSVATGSKSFELQHRVPRPLPLLAHTLYTLIRTDPRLVYPGNEPRCLYRLGSGRSRTTKYPPRSQERAQADAAYNYL